MRNTKLTTLLTLCLLWGLPAFALEKDDEEALRNTQNLLRDPQAMESFARENKDAANALQQVQKTVGADPRRQAEVNSIASDVFGDLVREKNGDTAAIEEKLQKAMKDPRGFMNSLSPAQQEKIRALANEIEAQNHKAPESGKP